MFNAIIELPHTCYKDTIIVEMDSATYYILSSLFAELERADRKYKNDPMTSAITGCHTIKCELAELEREVTRITANNDNTRKEAIQVTTMGFKFVRDICDKEDTGEQQIL